MWVLSWSWDKDEWQSDDYSLLLSQHEGSNIKISVIITLMHAFNWPATHEGLLLL